jgi:hypothetical protein
VSLELVTVADADGLEHDTFDKSLKKTGNDNMLLYPGSGKLVALISNSNLGCSITRMAEAVPRLPCLAGLSNSLVVSLLMP